jgi:hypothetical protein
VLSSLSTILLLVLSVTSCRVTRGRRCVEHAADLWQLVLSSLFTTACTVPVIAFLDHLFSSLRVPAHRAVQGECSRGPLSH